PPLSPQSSLLTQHLSGSYLSCRRRSLSILSPYSTIRSQQISLSVLASRSLSPRKPNNYRSFRPQLQISLLSSLISQTLHPASVLTQLQSSFRAIK
ncbi:hypothetical protein Ancab_004594, partial [Ancistrocladus abbreviatus]